MNDSPSLLMRKSHERGTLPRRSSDFPASPFSWQESQGRSGYPGLQPVLQQRKIFGFEIYIDNDILAEVGPLHEWFANLQTTNGVQHIGFNSDLTIPDLHGRNIQIYDIDMDKKYQCAKAMLLEVYQIFKRIKKEAFSVIIFVPEGMVSLLIGAKGHQINKIMKESHTTIVVNQPINRMTYRTAKIQGYHSDIAKACRIIYEMLQQKSAIAYSIEKEPSQLDYTKSKIKSKFIFNDPLVFYLERKKKRLLQKIEEETKCSIRFENDRQNRLLKKEETVCILTGRLQDVQAMVVMLINISHEYLSEDKKNLDYTLKMLIPANYVTKLIGQKGYMIRDIIDRSGGAMIKILSDKQEKDRECIISINGTKQNKIDAICFIMEQIQCFKNGGPILQSGKSINENLAQQFKNSLPLHQQDEKHDKDNLDLNGTHITHVTQSPTKMKDEGSQEEGLIEVEEENKDKQEQQKEKAEQVERQRRLAIEKDLERINPIRKDVSSSKRSNSDSHSRSRSRSRSKRKNKRMEFSKQGRSESESVEYKHDREAVEVKLVIPRKLGQDYKQLRYIESLCKSNLSVCDQVRFELAQKLQSGEMVLLIRGSLKDNSRCLQLLQKRLARFKPPSSTR